MASETVKDMTERETLFAQVLVSGKTKKQAAIDAGYSAKSAGAQASALLRKPKVAAFIQDLEEEASLAAGVTKTFIVSELKSIAEDMDAPASARVQALTKLGDILGMFPTRIDANIRGQLVSEIKRVVVPADNGCPSCRDRTSH